LDRYQANRLMKKISKRLMKIVLNFYNFEQISRIAFRYKMDEMMAKVMAYIEEKSDVEFVIEGQRLPAMKRILTKKNRVFRAMFLGDFKEAEDEEVVIEETTFEAFKTFILYLLCNHLVLKDGQNFEFIEELCKLSDRYESPRLLSEICEHLKTIGINTKNMSSVSRIAVKFNIKELLTFVETFIGKNLHKIISGKDEELYELNDSTDNRLLKVLANKYRNQSSSNSRPNLGRLFPRKRLL